MGDDLIKRVLSRNPKIIKNKIEYYALYDKGLFGNKPLTWSSYEEILESGWRREVCLRVREGCGVGRTSPSFDIPLRDVPSEIEKWMGKGISENSITFNQSLPNDKLLIQGEIYRNQFGFYLRYTNVKKPTNDGFEISEKHATGLDALNLIKSGMNSQSYGDYLDLVEKFPDSIVEFGSYSVNVGNILGRNTIIWEVRNF